MNNAALKITVALPVLTGHPTQVARANEIREKTINELQSKLDHAVKMGYEPAPLLPYIEKGIELRIEAKHWVDSQTGLADRIMTVAGQKVQSAKAAK